MKKLTIKQKLYNFWNNEKFKKARDIILFVSLGFNLLIVLLLCIGSCANKNSASSNSLDHSAAQRQLQSQQAINKKVKSLNTSFVNNGIYEIRFPSSIPTSQAQGTVYYDAHDYGLYFMPDMQYHTEQVKAFKGNTIRRTIWYNTDERVNYLTFSFYDYNDQRQAEAHYYQSNDGYFYHTDDWELASLYLTYDSITSNFFTWLDQFNTSFTFIRYTDFYFSNNWSVYDYVSNVNGLTLNEYRDESNRFIINNSRFRCNGITFKSMYFEFTIPGSSNSGGSILGYYLDLNGTLSFIKSDTRYKYAFNGLYYVDLSNNVYKVASPSETTFQNATDDSAMNVYNGTPCVVANTFSWTNESWRSITLTGSNYVDYIEAPLFSYNYNDETQIITLTGQPNDNAVSYLDYSLSITYTGISIYGDEADIYSPIDLLTAGFSGFVALFNITILPHITIGLLLFTPLVVAILILIFRILKK